MEVTVWSLLRFSRTELFELVELDMGDSLEIEAVWQ